MHAEIVSKRDTIIALCRRHRVTRLELFGSAARGFDFRPDRSDADFLVTFAPELRNDLTAFAEFRDALQALLGRPVDLLEREAVEASRNFIRRRQILAQAEPLHG
jgi:predicted nucleotidyltransferase